jgi:4-diphosphocytidyl-2-C-methyl-D-erythritol kinase
MQSYTLLAAAKINLYLEILGDQFTTDDPPRPTGYHELTMVMQSIDLADKIKIQSLSSPGIQVQCEHPEVPTGDRNLAYRAVQLMQQKFPSAAAQFGGVNIEIKKRIPVGAGLAGGSTNAAAVLVGLDLLWNLGLTQSELQDLGAQLGSDVPFCVSGGTALVTGRGEKVSPLPDLHNLSVVLGKFRSLSVSTAWAYQTYRHQFSESYVTTPEALQERWHQVHSGDLVRAISHNDGGEIGQCLYNDFERVVFPHYPEVAALRSLFCQQPVLGVLMSGSGPTVFALVNSAQQALEVKNQIQEAAQTTADPMLQAIAPDLDFWTAQVTPMSIRVVES